jgi:hypothetical protein
LSEILKIGMQSVPWPPQRQGELRQVIYGLHHGIEKFLPSPQRRLNSFAARGFNRRYATQAFFVPRRRRP